MENKNSIYYGLNSNIKINLIQHNPSKTKENAFILGQSGGGMGFYTKSDMINYMKLNKK